MKKLLLGISLVFSINEARSAVIYGGTAANVNIGIWHASWECIRSTDVCFVVDNGYIYINACRIKSSTGPYLYNEDDTSEYWKADID